MKSSGCRRTRPCNTSLDESETNGETAGTKKNAFRLKVFFSFWEDLATCQNEMKCLLVICLLLICLCVCLVDGVKRVTIHVAKAKDGVPADPSQCSPDLSTKLDLTCHLRSAWQYCANIAPQPCRIELMNAVRFIPDLGALFLLQNMDLELSVHNQRSESSSVISSWYKTATLSRFIRYQAPRDPVSMPRLKLEYISPRSLRDEANMTSSVIDIDGDIALTITHCGFNAITAKHLLKLQNIAKGYVHIDRLLVNAADMHSALFASNVRNLSVSRAHFTYIDSPVQGASVHLAAGNEDVLLKDLVFGYNRRTAAVFVGKENRNIVFSNATFFDCNLKDKEASYVLEGDAVRASDLKVRYSRKESSDFLRQDMQSYRNP